MAITWDITTSNEDWDRNWADVTFTRTDSESTAEPRQYSYRRVSLATPEDRATLLNTVKTKDAEAVSDLSEKATFLGDLVQSGVSNLQEWELTR